MKDSILDRETEIRTKAEAAGQHHLFAWWSDLDRAERASLLEQVDSIEFPLLESLVNDLVIHPKKEQATTLEPALIIPIPGSEAEQRECKIARDHGEALLREGKVAPLVVAGGQGTRLGFQGPKGAFPIGPVSNKCLFAFFAERILAAKRRYGPTVPWLIMTSLANDVETRKFFQENDFFGLVPEQVHFFVQGTMPAVDEFGKILLASRHEIARSPDGHGGTLRALDRSKVLEILEAQGIQEISYLQVDNVLAKVLDPVFIGHHALAGAEMSTKVVRKAYPEEKVGVIGMRGGKLGVIEYSDLGEEDTEARDPDGELKYWAGNIAIHMVNVAFARRLEASGIRLPFHRADKKVPFIDAKGRTIEPESPNGIKFESFIFDALGHAKNPITLEVRREEEFSPVKNATGVDSPETAQRDLMETFASWLQEAGVKVPRNKKGSLAARLEISPLYAHDREEAIRKIPPDLEITDDLLLTES
jgi:UDP-N-acetylglucosamine/UDP-N-acetylgalactosamine diphosphorylase